MMPVEELCVTSARADRLFAICHSDLSDTESSVLSASLSVVLYLLNFRNEVSILISQQSSIYRLHRLASITLNHSYVYKVLLKTNMVIMTMPVGFHNSDLLLPPPPFPCCLTCMFIFRHLWIDQATLCDAEVLRKSEVLHSIISMNIWLLWSSFAKRE